ncbi:hypothetical protein TIFTF001_034481 [Ficus carica]|uniref:Uncharacterized protein n=1 Tax=Ficus carica TaxID=3494 RepID=A0AA88J8W1_FICCA|nr:hypothetical protein TIFTF001_034481 [Ficus carica]
MTRRLTSQLSTSIGFVDPSNFDAFMRLNLSYSSSGVRTSSAGGTAKDTTGTSGAIGFFGITGSAFGISSATVHSAGQQDQRLGFEPFYILAAWFYIEKL